jgi:hypothetical protein
VGEGACVWVVGACWNIGRSEHAFLSGGRMLERWGDVWVMGTCWNDEGGRVLVVGACWWNVAYIDLEWTEFGCRIC